MRKFLTGSLALVALLLLSWPVLAGEPTRPKPSGPEQPGNPWRWTDEDQGYWWRWKIEPRPEPLADINAQRAARGLRAYVEDEGLTKAARACAEYRAARRMAGHTASDFDFLPAGVRSPCAGCAAWPADMPFGACEVFGDWKYAGAASVRGPDGLLYHHAFYR